MIIIATIHHIFWGRNMIMLCDLFSRYCTCMCSNTRLFTNKTKSCFVIGEKMLEWYWYHRYSHIYSSTILILKRISSLIKKINCYRIKNACNDYVILVGVCSIAIKTRCEKRKKVNEVNSFIMEMLNHGASIYHGYATCA